MERRSDIIEPHRCDLVKSTINKSDVARLPTSRPPRPAHREPMKIVFSVFVCAHVCHI